VTPPSPWPIRAGQWLVAALVAGLFGLLRLAPAKLSSDLGGAVARAVGPLIPRSGVARRQLTLAFPDKSRAEIEELVAASWENLGRTALEYPHLDQIWDYELGHRRGQGQIDVEGVDIFLGLRRPRKPTIVFTAHQANWELLAVCAAHYRLPISVFFRRPNNPYINALIGKIRGASMGALIPTDFEGALTAARHLEEGKIIGLLADQHFTRGPAIPFFGRPARTAPTLARLALNYDCAVHGAVVTRLPGGRFRLAITPALPLPATGTRAERVEALLTQVNKTIEGWVRAHPEQWLWLHRRWR
jgi:Kdo2-lipid IVA lauroyltransferase/acyltransferase